MLHDTLVDSERICTGAEIEDAAALVLAGLYSPLRTCCGRLRAAAFT